MLLFVPLTILLSGLTLISDWCRWVGYTVSHMGGVEFWLLGNPFHLAQPQSPHI